ncbi:MAG: ATP-dependent Clp protease adaptor ClpS [Treponema sp.]|nr:ATP-dependent Clp protease adaptor ClpS [Treponema sp.]
MDINFSADIFSVTETELKEPKKYHVVFLNDDFTTKEFVTQVLEVIYHKDNKEAEFLMEKVHQEGSAVVGTYTYDIAATRVNLTIKVAREYGFPLRCEMREA